MKPEMKSVFEVTEVYADGKPKTKVFLVRVEMTYEEKAWFLKNCPTRNK